MKIINIDIDNKIILRSVEDTHSKTIESITSNLRLPTGNYQSILLNFNFISPKDDTLYYFANFKTSKENIDVKIESKKVEDKNYQYACYVPQEIFLQESKVEIGLYAYNLNDDETLNKRYSLEPVKELVVKGSYDPDSKESIVPNASIFEIYFDKVDKAYIKFDEYVEEFTNKIDELFNNANQGLKKYKHFNSVADMKADNTLVAGYVVKTLGYYAANDGGGATYLIRTKLDDDVEDNGTIHFINDKLVAEMIIENNTINVLQFGVKNDGKTDSTIQLQNAINFSKKIIGCGGTILISSPININSKDEFIDIDFKNTTIKCISDSAIDYVLKIFSNNNNRVKGKIKNLYINSNGLSNISLYIQDTSQFYIKDIELSGAIVSEYKTDKNGNTSNSVIFGDGIRLVNGYEYGLTQCLNCVGFDIESPDSHYDNVVTLGYLTHFDNKALTFYNKIHSWNYKNDTINDSIMFKIKTQIVGSEIYCDTIQTMFHCYGDGGGVDVTNPIYFLNSSFYLSNHNVPTPIYVSDSFINNYGRIRLTNGRFNGHSGFSNVSIINYADRTSNFRLNLLRLVNTFIGSFACSRYFLEYSNDDLDLEIDLTNITSLSFYNKKIITSHGRTHIMLQGTINGISKFDEYITIASITDDDFVVGNQDSFVGFIRMSSDNLIHPILAKITSAKQVQINVPSGLNITGSCNLFLTNENVLLNTNTLVK